MLASRDLVEARSRRKRRSWTLEEKRRIVDEILEEGASIALVARRHDLNANQLFTWRRQFGVGGFEPKSLAPILPVTSRRFLESLCSERIARHCAIGRPASTIVEN
jgi:transposase